ncbi:unnamed protein product (macronuclear) [Paramecium tetraurelia]|uniref:Protein kinase domain-containing protein n=1 Tax=Paramecium tetraurelia TaxID=5888 RepID=A0C542_PARTE|nr:uncharacterized protein GSPATT00006408001 [Paramecium tetraurelia]CAK65909.1 unnamed protein product [Paramecium tetraurelia]|eukprot:XP_001433306.1 hypothetical protein (macronuclear) [Paramecium tetraurelia strain d4-2]
MQQYSSIEQFDELMSSKFYIEEVFDEMQNEKVDIPNTDKNKIMLTLKKEENLKEKNDFILSDDFNQFQQLLVISLITINFSSDDPFFRHITMVVKAIKKAIKKRLTQETNYFQSVQEFKNQQSSLFKIFYQDINIGFITSTLQIKSTAFIFIKKSLVDSFINKKISIEQKNQRARLTLSFFNINIQKEIIVQQDFKNQFLRNNRFKNDFIVLNEEFDQQKQSTTYHVYKPMDDQIYFVKRIQLQDIPINVTFQDIFNTKSFNQDNLTIQEARILLSISHPNIIRHYDWWLEQKNQQIFLYTQIEYCIYPGYISQTKNLLSFSYFYMNPMPIEQKSKLIIEIICQIISGLEYLQQKQIIHGDLKPESIMVTQSITGDIQVMLADLNHQYLYFEEMQKQFKQDQPQYKQQSLQALGVLLMHLILTFPGEPTLRNNFVTKFSNFDFDDSLSEFDKWAQKSVKNRHKEFSFFLYKNFMLLAKSLLQKQQFHELHDVRTFILKQQII